uniref:Uncharacterized protein TCIL3000_10_13980 n=1 Tax=Trypanosoma congolense (strain IL3000) TaxID=1068625 RepID=G0UYZ5_TRYCI|nr:unnamed protein product [Trypanosoma congolense IL3000]
MSDACANYGDGTQQSGDNSEATKALSMLNQPFASRKPKHIGQGLLDAAQNVAVGVGMGLGSLIALPVACAKEEGLKGAAKGVGLGLLGLATGTLAGAVTGSRQLVRGIISTTEAVKETVHGERYWCSIREQWIEVRLDEMLSDLPQTDADIYRKAHEKHKEFSAMVNKDLLPGGAGEDSDGSSAGGSCGRKDPGAKDYYATLGVEKKATPSQIRAAFHRKALELHPDKNAGDAEATKHFQEVLEAYGVLNDDMKRSQYDMHGTVNTTADNDGLFTPMEEVLGARQMEAFIGRVEWAIYLTPNTFFSPEIKKELRLRRMLRIAKNLLQLVDGGDAAIEAARPGIADAVATRAGRRYMPVVAEQYATAARQHLANTALQREVDRFGASKLASLCSFKNAAVACATTAVKAAKKDLDEEALLDTILSVCQQDVQKTVLRAARLVLYDLSVTEEKRRKRANTLLSLSKVIEDVCSSVSRCGK